ncbi:hypothetical protein CEXT_259921 [Caerostris extrusa]|uniref:Uncharacterized protein n=1 Tax=Caerostris extrusa TaxID=172846 RepID=A0AAV4TU60_CAEEX|nr:hypothetical protein CEXT_259921 [Caerostris extrusa]
MVKQPKLLVGCFDKMISINEGTLSLKFYVVAPIHKMNFVVILDIEILNHVKVSFSNGHIEITNKYPNKDIKDLDGDREDRYSSRYNRQVDSMSSRRRYTGNRGNPEPTRC